MSTIKRLGMTIHVYDIHPDGTTEEIVPKHYAVAPYEFRALASDLQPQKPANQSGNGRRHPHGSG